MELVYDLCLSFSIFILSFTKEYNKQKILLRLQNRPETIKYNELTEYNECKRLVHADFYLIILRG